MKVSEKWGTDVDTAVELALQELNASKEEVDIEVLEQPSRGFFGIGSKLALVRVSLKDKEEELKKEDDKQEFAEEVQEISTEDANVDSEKASENNAEARQKSPSHKKKKKKSNSSSRKKKLIKLGIAGAVLLVLVLGVAFATGVFSSKAKVPDMSDMTYKEAKKTAEKSGFKVEKGKSVYSSEISEGHVVEQDPSGGEEAKKGSTITVHLSKGSKEGTVPNIVGQDYKKVEKKLKKAGYKLGIVKSETSNKPEGTILTQDPAAGTNADKGTKINITISDGKGKEKGTVPSLTGKSLEEAKSAITNAGFKVGNISCDVSNVYGNGYVMWQQYAANTSLEKGETIDIEVSKGKPSSGSSSDNSNNSGTRL